MHELGHQSSGECGPSKYPLINCLLLVLVVIDDTAEVQRISEHTNELGYLNGYDVDSSTLLIDKTAIIVI